MCTAVSVTAGDHFFGRNLDYEHSFGEKITITPRHFPFRFQTLKEHYAIIGTALPYKGYPLYFDAMNEKGLCAAALNFPEMAQYRKPLSGRKNIPAYDLISWVLSSCQSIRDAKELLSDVNITDEPFSPHLPPSPLHWLFSDQKESITIEQTQNGLFLYHNPIGVLTNSPTFDMQLFSLNNYLSVSAKEPENRFFESLPLSIYSRGMGGLGLPGDLSSMSRFVRASFTKLNAIFEGSEEEKVNQFFYILQSVFQIKGCAQVGEEFEKTNYSACCNATKGIYYYKTYASSRIYGIDMFRENLNADKLRIFPMVDSKTISLQN